LSRRRRGRLPEGAAPARKRLPNGPASAGEAFLGCDDDGRLLARRKGVVHLFGNPSAAAFRGTTFALRQLQAPGREDRPRVAKTIGRSWDGDRAAAAAARLQAARRGGRGA